MISDDQRSARALFHYVIGFVGLGLGILMGLAATLEMAEQMAWFITPIGGAICATLLFDLVRAVVRRLSLAGLLARLGLFGLNAVLFTAELMLLVVAQG